MARIASGTIVTGLTAAALAGVGVLAWQASAAPDHTGRAHPATSAQAKPSTAPSKPPAPRTPAVPADSGSGKRVVYSLAGKRVWLVEADGHVARTFPVVPGTLAPAPGTYHVTYRAPQTTGSDKVAIEHLIVFDVVEGRNIGFSAAVDGSLPTAQNPGIKTGGIRERTADGDAMWPFAPKGATVVVTP
ncbi:MULTISPECIES: L,D-transpeptidase [Streptomycetaceae]|uniref:Secreted protein n=1 Tax=Streptantibioticus cattleyicolor (strain ATCC 35852 / DSM 46488 / JCM 4925 / NBRC 14057 / NRRL 8057) TaxID=1003195 RepID=F8JZC0_STREN|nr:MULTISPECIES: L,D-transpeptidase [Streptomycetaceae]AEW96002.1 secreted protein [Streptantibioticus cattleyicolor NRRL 8057 = DSM 46488]MYS60534.1 hypothetical protein [Streptomyces sp. SID5468]CCB76333.1 Secreted protein [Streptantibioticus cattleyicolor NRRL 8057 = DSM 46488]